MSDDFPALDERTQRLFDYLRMDNDSGVLYLLRSGVSPNAMENEETALRVAAGNESCECVRLLLEHGADVDRRNATGETALMRALDRDRPEAARLLIERGADIHARSNTFWGMLHWTAITNNVAMMRYLVTQGGLDINARNSEGNTPLATAAIFDRPAMIAQLLQAGADVRVGNETSYSPLVHAFYNEDVASVHLLLNAGAVAPAEIAWIGDLWNALQAKDDKQILRVVSSEPSAASRIFLDDLCERVRLCEPGHLDEYARLDGRIETEVSARHMKEAAACRSEIASRTRRITPEVL